MTLSDCLAMWATAVAFALALVYRREAADEWERGWCDGRRSVRACRCFDPGALGVTADGDDW